MLDLTKTLLNNLYKFIFVCGLLVSTSFLFIPEYMEYKWMEKAMELRKDLNEVEFKMAVYSDKADLDYAENDLFMEDEINNISDISELKDHYLKNKEKSALRKERFLEVDKLRKNIKADSDLQTFILGKINKIQKIKKYGVIAGLSLSFLGLIGWLIRVQIPLDRKLKESAAA